MQRNENYFWITLILCHLSLSLRSLRLAALYSVLWIIAVSTLATHNLFFVHLDYYVCVCVCV